MELAEKQRLVESVPVWFHSIDFGDGLVSPGICPAEILQGELERMHIPDLTGKTVLDVGAWDGYYAFAAERMHARRVVALDHYVWSLDLERQQAYWNRCRESNRIPAEYHRVQGLWSPGMMPGKKGFDTAHRILDSHVEEMAADYMLADPEELGSFDVVFFRGVLYHMKEPLRALRRLALFTRELAIIETAAIFVPDHEDDALFEFYAANELNADASNWWAPNLTALAKCCRAAGFRHVEAVSGYPAVADPSGIGKIHRYRLTVHARH